MKKITRAVLLITVLLAVTAIPAWASQEVGSSPYTADLLVSGLNTGRLDPGQEYWYAYSRLDLGDAGYNSIILSLNFEAAGRSVASRVNFQVFTFAQVDAWLKDSTGPVDSLGLGTPASSDFDVNTGERFWAGSIEAQDVYYVRIFNLSPSPVEFRLTALGQKNERPEAFMAIETAAANSESQVIPAAVNVPQPAAAAAPAKTSVMPALPVQPDNASPASTRWLLAAQAINGLAPQDAAGWLMSAAALGWLPGANSDIAALLPVDPNADQPAGSEGGGDEGGDNNNPPAVPADPNSEAGQSIYPNQPLTLLDGSNIGRMAPNTEQWYTFTREDLDHELVENLSLTMFFTPGEPNIARHVTFEMFTGGQYHIWERGTPKDMENFGVGSWISRDGDYITGERLWHGTIVDGDKYFVKVTNDTQQWIDYHLLTGDVTNIEMEAASEAGQSQPIKARPVLPAEIKPATGKSIGSPLPIDAGTTEGHLAAGEDIWFEFFPTDTDLENFELQHFQMTLEHTPGAGFVTNYVNVEVYPFQEQHIWQRGDTNKIKPLGAGSDMDYDQDTDTHIWAWDGHLISNTTYFVRIKNESPRAIDYSLLIQQR